MLQYTTKLFLNFLVRQDYLSNTLGKHHIIIITFPFNLLVVLTEKVKDKVSSIRLIVTIVCHRFKPASFCTTPSSLM